MPPRRNSLSKLGMIGEELGCGGLSCLRGKLGEAPTKKKKNCIVALAHHKARTAYPMNLAALRFQLGRMSPLMILI